MIRKKQKDLKSPNDSKKEDAEFSIGKTSKRLEKMQENQQKDFLKTSTYAVFP